MEKIIFSNYSERNEFLKYMYWDLNFSNNLNGTSWYNKSQELFHGIRLHIAKIRLFREISDEHMNDHWIKTEIIGRDIHKMISMKASKWTINKKLFTAQVESWLKNFPNSSVLYTVLSDDYKPYREAFMSLHKLSKPKEISKFIENDSEFCNMIFVQIMKVLADQLSDRHVNTKNATSTMILEPIYEKLLATLERLYKE